MGNGRAFGCGSVAASGMVLPRGTVGDMALLQCWRCWQVGPLLHALLYCWGAMTFERGNRPDAGIGRAIGGGLSVTGGAVLPPHIIDGSSLLRR